MTELRNGLHATDRQMMGSCSDAEEGACSIHVMPILREDAWMLGTSPRMARSLETPTNRVTRRKHAPDKNRTCARGLGNADMG